MTSWPRKETLSMRFSHAIVALLILAGTAQTGAQDLQRVPPFTDYQTIVRTVPPAGPCDESLRPPLIQIGVAVLQDIRELELRPPASPDNWVLAVRSRYRACVSGRLGEEVRGRSPSASTDELEVRNGSVQRRLIRLALTGRVTKAEFDSLAKRLQGN
jgi:hypothetical protein